jgi:predicted AAA+ superfamily ATPase
MFADENLQDDPSASVQRYNFEDPDVLSLGGWKQIYDHINGRIVSGKTNSILLDEVQNVSGFERLVDGLFIKKNVDLYVTGSNAMLLSGELATLLTGRYVELSILPFSFSEYLAANPQNFRQAESFADFPLALSVGYLREYLVDGGIPQAVEMRHTPGGQPSDYLRNIVGTVVEKDIFKRHKINNKAAFWKVVDFLLDSIGSLVSPNSIAKSFKADSVRVDHETVAQYLDQLSAAFLFYRAPRCDVRGKNLLKTLDKYYVADSGFRQTRLAKGRGADFGHLLENAVYLELRRRSRDVFVGKWREHEIDFVSIDKEGYTSYYQVAYSTVDPSTLERELRPLAAIRDSNPKYLLTLDTDDNPVYDGIRKLNAADWLLGRVHTP